MTPAQITEELPAIGKGMGATLQGRPGEDVVALDSEYVIALYKRYGAVFFRGFGTDVNAFERFSGIFTRDASTNRGAAFATGPFKRSTVNGVPTLLSATGKRQDFALPLHGEIYYLANPPQMIWFYCARPAEKDGETTLADGEHLLAAMRPEIADRFRAKKIRYHRTLADSEWRNVFQTDDRAEAERIAAAFQLEFRWLPGDAIETSYTCSAIVRDERGRENFINDLLPVAAGELAVKAGQVEQMKETPIVLRWEDGSPLDPALIQELLATAWKVEVPVPAGAGDFLMVDNTRVLHGRRPSASPDRSVIVRMGSRNF